jgi:hypothetical protein
MNPINLFYKSFALGLLILLFSFKPEEKYFEGKVEYKMEITSRTHKEDAKQMQKAFGTRATFYFKQGNYKDEYNGTGMRLDFIDVKASKYYFKTTMSDTFYMMDASKITDSIVSVKINKSSKKVAGYSCDELIVKTISIQNLEKAELRFYFNSALKVNPEWFRTIHIASSDVIYRAMKSIPLMYILDYGHHVTTVTATKVTETAVSDDEVHIPKDAVVKNADQ